MSAPPVGYKEAPKHSQASVGSFRPGQQTPCHQDLATPVTLLLLSSMLCQSAARGLGCSTSVPLCTSRHMSRTVGQAAPLHATGTRGAAATVY